MEELSQLDAWLGPWIAEGSIPLYQLRGVWDSVPKFKVLSEALTYHQRQACGGWGLTELAASSDRLLGILVDNLGADLTDPAVRISLTDSVKMDIRRLLSWRVILDDTHYANLLCFNSTPGAAAAPQAADDPPPGSPPQDVGGMEPGDGYGSDSDSDMKTDWYGRTRREAEGAAEYVENYPDLAAHQLGSLQKAIGSGTMRCDKCQGAIDPGDCLVRCDTCLGRVLCRVCDFEAHGRIPHERLSISAGTVSVTLYDDADLAILNGGQGREEEGPPRS